MPDDVAVLFLYTVANGGRPVLARVHASSLALPVDLEGRAVMWLGQGSDAESVPLVRRLHDQAPTAELREDVVSIVGVHSTSSLVVPVLVDWVEGRGADGARIQALDGWAGTRSPSRSRCSPAPRGAIASPTCAAKPPNRSPSWSSGRQRTRSSRSLARWTTPLRVAKRSRGWASAETTDRWMRLPPRAQRRDPDIQREGAESLGESGSPRSFPMLFEVARTHPSVDVRREAVETIGENFRRRRRCRSWRNRSHRPECRRSARSDRVARRNEERPGALDRGGVGGLHPSTDARREAVETMGEASQSDATLAALARLARDESNAEVATRHWRRSRRPSMPMRPASRRAGPHPSEPGPAAGGDGDAVRGRRPR